jgi:hypothetical protein
MHGSDSDRFPQILVHQGLWEAEAVLGGLLAIPDVTISTFPPG